MNAECEQELFKILAKYDFIQSLLVNFSYDNVVVLTLNDNNDRIIINYKDADLTNLIGDFERALLFLNQIKESDFFKLCSDIIYLKNTFDPKNNWQFFKILYTKHR
jgi:hypothetical protein